MEFTDDFWLVLLVAAVVFVVIEGVAALATWFAFHDHYWQDGEW
jgi:hypothetical protein